VVLDVRQGVGPAVCFDYALSVLVTTDRAIAAAPAMVAAAVRGIVQVQGLLKADVGLAGAVGRRLFPAAEAATIAAVIGRDLAFYDPVVSEQSVVEMNRFCLAVGLQSRDVAYDDVVAREFRHLWLAAAANVE
jgi:hypothetical protein